MIHEMMMMIWSVSPAGMSIESAKLISIAKSAQRKTATREKNGMVKRPDSRLPPPVCRSLPRKTGPGMNLAFCHDVRHTNTTLPIVIPMQLSESASSLKARAVEVRIASRASFRGNSD